MFSRKKQEKETLDAAVKAAGRPATELKSVKHVLEGHVFPPTSTHFGGTPYFEGNDTWPCLDEDGRPYDFICQVNLNDCPVRPDVPFDLFSVFLCWSLLEEVDFDRTCIVRTYSDVSTDKAASVSRPVPVCADDYKVRPCAVKLEECITYPSWSVKEEPEIALAAGKFRNPDTAFADSLKRLGFLRDFRSRISGHPTWVHDNTLDGESMTFLTPPSENIRRFDLT